jgi:hypothetical protein
MADYALDTVESEFEYPVASTPVQGSYLPAIQCGPWALSPEVKRPEREADHSSRTSTEVKKTWIYTFTPLSVLMALCLIS